MKDIEDILQNINQYDTADGHGNTDDVMDKDVEERIYNMTMRKINSAQNEEKSKNKKVIPFNVQSSVLKVAVCILAVILIPGTVVFAAHAMHMEEKFANFFGRGTGDDSEVINNIQDVHEAAEVDGVSVSVEQMLGDETGFYALLKVTGFTDAMKEKIGYMQPAFENIDAVLEDGTHPEMSGLINMGIDFDTKDYYFILKINSSVIVNSDITLIFDNMLVDDGTENTEGMEHLIDGQWKIKLTPDYKNEAVGYEVNKQVEIDGKAYIWNAISVSPLSVTIDITAENGGTITTDEIKEMFYVDFSDGSRLDARYVEDTFFYVQDNLAVISFDRIHKLEDVVSVTFAKETYLIDEGRVMNRIMYENQEMGFTLLIPEEIYDIMSVETFDNYHDRNFDVDGKKAVFRLTKDETSIDAFTVYALNGEYTEEQAEEKNPMAAFLTSKDGVTYLFEYGEIIDEKQMEVFPDIMNKYVAYMMYFFDLKENRR